MINVSVGSEVHAVGMHSLSNAVLIFTCLHIISGLYQDLLFAQCSSMPACSAQDAKNQAANRSRSKAAPPKTAKLLVAAKQMFTQWKVTGLEEASEDDSWGSGQAVKKWARPARQRNSATAYINHRQSLIFEGGQGVWHFTNIACMQLCLAVHSGPIALSLCHSCNTDLRDYLF